MTAPVTPPSPLPSDLIVDRRAEERADAALLATLRADPSTRVLVVHGDAAPLTADGRLALVGVEPVPADAEWAFLGREANGSAVLLAAFDSAHDAPIASPDGWGSLRVVAGGLPAGEAEVFVTAVSLARWLTDAAFCPACGTLTIEGDSGWSRRCPSCGRQHFPRTDPAVIVAVTRADDPDLLLLGSNALWGENRYSCFAGFVEAGESLEGAVTREVGEEAGVEVSEVTYRGSQGWPYPRSLMLGFRASAAVPADARPDGEEIVDVRWFTRAEIAAGLAGESELKLPGSASIAHRLITDWLAETA
jgi:NAD+ diphosphatase